MINPKWVKDDFDSVLRIKGSDDKPRSVKEWYNFISESIHHAAVDSPLKKELINARWELHYDFQCKEEGMEPDMEFGDLSHRIGDAALEFFRLALDDAYKRGSSTSTRLDYMSDHMISFAKQLSSKTTTRVHQVGFALLAYVDAHERLPDQPKDLEEFTEKNSTMGRIPRKTISEQLRHYKLENIVRGKQSG